MLETEKSGLHEFARPPVVETILGVHFKPIRGLTTAHLGMFWNSLGREQWPNLRELGAVTPQIERLDISPTAPFRLILKEVQQPQVRLRFSNVEESKIVQLQANLLQTHWVRTPGTDYPRYTASTKPEFLKILDHFARFIRQERLDGPEMLQWEVTYINRIPAGEGQLWKQATDWAGFFNGVLVPPAIPNGLIESARASYHYRLAGDKGRLHIEARHKLGAENEPDSLEVKLTARGHIDVADPGVERPEADGFQQPISTGLDIGRQAIVNGFVAIVSEKALDFWGYAKDNADA